MNLNTLKNILKILFLGALGSGVWSIAGQPIYDNASSLFISLAEKVYHGYYDLLHANIGKGYDESASVFIKGFIEMFVTGMTLTLPVISYLLYRKVSAIADGDISVSESKEKKTPEDRKKRVKRVLVFSCIYPLLFAPLFISNMITDVYRNSAVTFTEQSLEIIAPQVSNQEYIELRARYRSLKDAASFYSLHDSMLEIAEAADIELPEFKLARKHNKTE